jgi:hypothetical protein
MGSLKTKSAFGKRTCENKSGLARFVSIKAAEYACRRGKLLDGAWGRAKLPYGTSYFEAASRPTFDRLVPSLSAIGYE